MLSFSYKKFALLLSIICLTGMVSATFGQILNAERFGSHTRDSEEFLKGSWSLAYRAVSQKDVIRSAKSKVDISMQWKKNEIIAASQYSILFNGTEQLVNRGFVHVRYRRGPSHKFTPETFSQVQLDGARGMVQRALIGENLRMRLQRDSLGIMYLGVGLMYEREVWNYKGAINDSISSLPGTVDRDLLKLNIYLSFRRLIAKNVTFGLVAYYQARPDVNIVNPRIAGDLQLAFKVNKILSLTLGYNWFYDRAPVVPIADYYYTTTGGLRFSF